MQLHSPAHITTASITTASITTASITNTTQNPSYVSTTIEVREDEGILQGNPAYGTTVAQGREREADSGPSEPPIKHVYEYITASRFMLKEEEIDNS